MTEGPSGGRLDRARLAAEGFGRRAEVYERSRPGYPAAAVSLLTGLARLGEGRVVVDLAAGTGKLTRQLLASGAACVAVEPSPDMRAVCRRTVPGAPLVAGAAEALPLRPGSVDLVTVAQAFHWFDAPSAMNEAARVLRPGGVLALVWNVRDESVPWVAELGRIMADVGQAPGGTPTSLLDTVPPPPLLPFEYHRFGWTAPIDRNGLVDLVASRSYVNVLADDERARVRDTVGDFAARLPEAIEFPYVTEVLTARSGRRAAGGAGGQDGAVKEGT